MYDYSKMSRSDCVAEINIARHNIRRRKRMLARTNADPRLQSAHARSALDSAEVIVLVRDRQMQLDREERDALAVALQRATLEPEEAREEST